MGQIEPRWEGLRRAGRLTPLWLCILWAAWLSQQSGFDVLDYHASLALAPVVALAAGWLTIGVLRHKGPEAGITALGAWWPVAIAVLAPLIVLWLNGLRVPNCAPGTGLLLYALGPMASAGVAVAMASLAWRLAPERPRLLFGAVALLSCAPALWHFLSQPQVTAYAPLVGYIAGPLYEDVIEPDWVWLSFRALDCGLWLALLAASRTTSPMSMKIAVAVAATALVVGWIRAPLDGWRVDVQTVARALPMTVAIEVPSPQQPERSDVGPRVAPHPAVVLHMAGGAEQAWLRVAVVGDAREAYMRLWRFFGRPAEETISVWLYPDVATKHRLMGARNVEMAKPWLGQVHMVLPTPGGTTLRHELAHVFAAALGSRPFSVPMRGGWLPDALLIEGVAVAAEWPRRGGLDPHGQARAMRQLELAPPLQSLLTPTGFFAHSGARSYTLAGSFVRWLVDQHGPALLGRLYPNGDWEAAAGEPLDELVAGWERFVDSDAAARLTERDLELARARFEPGGLFQRPCAAEIGRCRARAGRAFVAGNVGLERRLREGLMRDLEPWLSDRPLGPDLAIALAGARARAGDHDAALAALNVALEGSARSKLSRLRHAAILRARGDIRLRANDRAGALLDWTAAAAEPLSKGGQRGLIVRRRLSATDSGRQWLLNWMLLGRPAGRWPMAIEALSPLAINDPVAAYLHARFILIRDVTDAPARRLAALAPTLHKISPALAVEAWRLFSWLSARHGRCAAMGAGFAAATAMGDDATSSWRRDVAETCRIRADWHTSASASER